MLAAAECFTTSILARVSLKISSPKVKRVCQHGYMAPQPSSGDVSHQNVQAARADEAHTHLHTEGEAGSRSLVPCSWWKRSQRANSQHYSCRIQMLRRGKCRKCCFRASRWWYLEEEDTSQLESQGETNDSVEMGILVDFQRTAKALYLYSLGCFLLIFFYLASATDFVML